MSSWPRWSLVVIVMVATLGTWTYQRAGQEADWTRRAQAEARYTLGLVEHDLMLQIEAISRHAGVWALRDPLDPAIFQAEAGALMAGLPGALGIFWLDDQASPRFSHPPGTPPISDPVPDGTGATGTTIAPLPTVNGLAIRAPLVAPGRAPLADAPQTLLVEIDAQAWLTHLLDARRDRDPAMNFSVSMTLDNVVLAQAPGWDLLSDPPVRPATLDLLGGDLGVEIRAMPGIRAAQMDMRPLLMALIVAALGALCVTALRLLDARNRAAGDLLRSLAKLNASNTRLNAEIGFRRAAESSARLASEQKSKFVATLSHEVRTPLNAIMGMFELLAAAPGMSERERRQAQIGLTSAEKLLAQLTDVIELSRLDAQATRLTPAPVATAALVEEWTLALDAMVHKAGKPGVQTRVDLDPAVPRILLVDRQRLGQVITNVLHNAVKFTETGSVRLRMARDGAVTGDPLNGAIVPLRIEVSDTGCGIAAADRQLVFDRFAQTAAGAQQAAAGSGLGLSIARDLLELMEGDIALEETKGGGCTFILSFKTTAVSTIKRTKSTLRPPAPTHRETGFAPSAPMPGAT